MYGRWRWGWVSSNKMDTTLLRLWTKTVPFLPAVPSTWWASTNYLNSDWTPYIHISSPVKHWRFSRFYSCPSLECWLQSREEWCIRPLWQDPGIPYAVLILAELLGSNWGGSCGFKTWVLILVGSSCNLLHPKQSICGLSVCSKNPAYSPAGKNMWIPLPKTVLKVLPPRWSCRDNKLR